MAIQTELIGVGSRGNEVRYPTPHSGLERLNLFMENKFEFMPRLLARIALTRQYSSPHAYSYGNPPYFLLLLYLNFWEVRMPPLIPRR